MTDAKTLIELADRVEVATGPDRELDVAIAVAVQWRWPDYEDGESNVNLMADRHGLAWLTERAIGGHNSCWRNIPAFTASLDAAMTLVPEGWTATITRYCDGASANLEDDRVHPVRLAGIATDSATPALALTAASLRALASMMEKNDGAD